MPIPIDAFFTGFLARDLDGLVAGLEIERVAIGEDRTLAITFQSAGGAGGRLNFLYDPAFPVVWFAEQGHARTGELPAPRFEDALRGATVTAVRQAPPALERVIEVEVADGAFRLFFEIAPPFPNLFLADRRGAVLAVLLRAGTRTKRRIIAAGEPYVMPAAQAKTPFSSVDPRELEALAWRDDPEILTRTVAGVSPLLAREIVARALKLGSIAEAFREISEAYRARRVEPCVFRAAPSLSKHAPEIGLSWWRPTLEGVRDVRVMSSANAAAASAARAFLRTSVVDRRRSALARAAAKEMARWEAVARDAEKARRRGEKAAELRRWGDLLTVHLGRIKKGASQVTLPNIYSESGGEVTVPLEPQLSPHANADSYFKQARRAERRARLAEETLRQARIKVNEIGGILTEVERAGGREINLARLGELERSLTRAPRAAKEKEAEVDQRAAALGIRPRLYVVSDGWTVLVGRSATQNDILTHKYAAPTDLWFHARQAQGSHVVLKRDRKKTEPSRQAIIEAARLAAYFSKAKTSKHVPVSYTEKRYVKKVRKGAPGLAVMLREKVVFVTPAIPQ